jgi:hypothetical protein
MVSMEVDAVYQLSQQTTVALSKRYLIQRHCDQHASLRVYATTTVKAPNGVTRMASVNAYATKFATSPMIMSASISEGA